MQASASVVPGVDDYAVAVIVFAEYVGIYRPVAFVVHGFDVDIAEPAAGEFLNHTGVVLYPAPVEQRTHRGYADRGHDFLEFASVRLAERAEHLLSGLPVEHMVPVLSRDDFLAVDGQEQVSGRNLRSRLVERPAVNDFLHEKAVTAEVVGEEESQLGRRIVTGLG